MLRSLHVAGFKSLADVSLTLPRLTVLFGPNAAGKSNVLDAIQALSRIGTLRTVSDAIADPIRGYPIEAFAFPRGGLPELLGMDKAEFTLSADLVSGREGFRYRVGVAIEPGSGRLSITDEYLALLGSQGQPKGPRPSSASAMCFGSVARASLRIRGKKLSVSTTPSCRIQGWAASSTERWSGRVTSSSGGRSTTSIRASRCERRGRRRR